MRPTWLRAACPNCDRPAERLVPVVQPGEHPDPAGGSHARRWCIQCARDLEAERALRLGIRPGYPLSW